jgi:hypothetical protein
MTLAEHPHLTGKRQPLIGGFQDLSQRGDLDIHGPSLSGTLQADPLVVGENRTWI